MKSPQQKKAKSHIVDLIRERDKLLEKHSELKPVQRAIDSKLSEKGRDPDQRSKMMFEIMLDQYEKELTSELDEMSSIKTVIKEIKGKKKTRQNV